MQGKKAHFGYRIVVALVLTSFIPLSLGLSCAGIFYPSLSVHLDVDPGILSYYTSVIWIASLVSLPFMGNLLDRGDARVFISLAVAIAAASFVWLSFTAELWQFYVGAFAMGISVGMLLFLAPSTLVNRWFHKRAGFLIGLVMAFTGIGGVVWSTVGGILIDAIGWSYTYLVFAGLSLCVLPATVFLVASHPREKGLMPYGAVEDDAGSRDPNDGRASTGPSGTNGAPLPSSEEADATHFSKVFRSPLFYLLCLMCFPLNIGMYLYFMIPSYATTIPIGAEFALLGATASSVAMAGQTISKLVLGSLGERHPEASTLGALACGVVGTLMLWLLGNGIATFYIASFLFGVYYGITNVMMPIFTRLCFGSRGYARIYSRISMVASVSNASAAFIWGSIIGLSGSYVPLFVGVAALMVITMGIVIAIGAMRKRQRQSC